MLGQRPDHGPSILVNQGRNHLVRGQDSDSVSRQGALWEIFEVPSHDGVRPGFDGGSQNVPVVLIGEDECVDVPFMADY